MSPSAVAKSIVAAICADAAGPSKPEKSAAEKPARSFSQTSALVNARRAATADNVVTSDVKGGQGTVDRSASSSGSALPAGPSRARGRKVTPTSESMQGLEALMQAAGWATQVRPASARPGRGQAEKTVNRDGTVTKAPAPHGERSALSQSGEPLAEAMRLTLAKGLRGSVPARVSGEVAAVSGRGGSGSTAQAVPAIGQVAGGAGKGVEMVSKRAVAGSHNALVPEKGAAAVKEHPVELKQEQAKATVQPGVQQAAETSQNPVLQNNSAAMKGLAAETKAVGPQAKSNVQGMAEASKSRGPEKASGSTKEHSGQPTQAAIRPNEESNALRPAESAKSPVPRTERAAPQHPERTEAANEKPFLDASSGVQPPLREMNSHGRSSPASSGESTHARQAANGVILPTDGKEASVSPAGDNLMAQAEPAVSGADKPVAFSRLASNQIPTAGGLEGSAARESAQSISEQIRDSLHASLDRGERQVVIRLHPPELGSVLVRFQEQNEQIHGILEVGRGDTRQEVEQALPQVLRSLQEAGIQIRKFDVTVSDQSERDPGRQQLYQDAWPQQQGSDRQTNRPQRSAFEHRIPDSESPTAARVPVGRIDMLA